MANTTIEELLNLAYEVRDADQAGENTALRVGGLLEEIIQYLSTVVGLDTLQAILEGYATVTGNGVINWRQSRIICLASMGYDLDNIDGGNWNYTNFNGDIVFSPSGGGSLNVVGATGDFSVLQNVVYVNNHTGHAYLWKLVGNTFKMVEIRDSSPTTIITYLNTPPFSQVAVGESYYYTSGSTRKIAIKLSSDEVYSFDPDPKKIYVFLDTKQAMVWNSGNRQWISVGGNLIQIINDLTTGGGDKALSAEMGPLLKSNINTVQANIVKLYNKLANMAFWDATDQAAAEPTPLDWQVPKKTVTLDLSGVGGHITVLHGSDEVADGDTIQVDGGSSLVLTLVADSGYTLSAVASSTSGAVVSQDNSTVTLAHVTADVTLTIIASVDAKPELYLGKLSAVVSQQNQLYIQNQPNATRATILIDRDSVSNPVTWPYSASQGALNVDTQLQQQCTLIPIPADKTKVSLQCDAAYYYGLTLVDASGNAQNTVEWTPGNTKKELLFSNFPNASYIAINFKIGSAGTAFFTNETYESMDIDLQIS